MVIVKKTKDLFKSRGLKTSEDAIKALGAEFEKLCHKVADNVIADKLKTVKPAHVPSLDSFLSSSSDS